MKGRPIRDSQFKSLVGELRKLKQLEAVWVHGGVLSGATLRELGQLKHLRGLVLERTGLTDAGLAEILAELPQLTELHLIGVPVTDVSVDAICSLSHLTKLRLKARPLSDDVREKLKRELPDCEFSWR